MSTANELSTPISQFIGAVASGDDVSVSSQKIADSIATRSASLLELIQALGPTLTSDDTTTRTYAVHCLASVLSHENLQAVLSKQDVGVLLQFLVSKLEDEKLSIYVLQALDLLVKCKNFIPSLNNSLETLLKAVLDHYEPRKHLAKVRYEGFSLLSTIFDQYSQTIAANTDLANLFVSTFVHVASGEKDPRNLLASFQLNATINETVVFDDRTTNKTHDQLLTDLFDVCFCYFPISFTPPANDPYKISADQLKLELRKTIASQSQFAQDTFVSLFEKLTSTNPAVRNDVSLTIHQCVEQYSQSTIEQYWTSIWDALKFEILHNDVLVFRPEANYIIPPDSDLLENSDDNKTLILTLQTLQAIAAKLQGTDAQAAFLDTVIGDIRKNFVSLSEKTLKQSVLILCAIGSSSVVLYNKVVHFLFSFEVWGKYIRSDYQQQDTEEDIALTTALQRELIDNLGFVFSACGILDQETDVLVYKDHILIFMGQLLQASSKLEKTLKCKITQQLVKLMGLCDFLSREEVTLILGWLNDILVAIVETENWESDILLSEVVGGLVRVMSEGSDESVHASVSSIIETVLPELLNHTSEHGVLDIINRLCVNYQFLEVLSIRLLNKLAYDSYDPLTYSAVVECLIKSFVQTQKVKPFLTNSWYTKFIPRFLSITLKKCNDDFMVLELGGQLFGLVVRYIEKGKHQEIMNEMVPVFIGGKAYEGAVLPNLLTDGSPKITLFKYFLAKIDRSTTFPGDIDAHITNAIAVVKDLSDEYVRVEYLQVLSLLVNKFTPQNTSNDELLNVILGTIELSPADFEVFVWIVKALIVRIDTVGFKYLGQIVTQLTLSPNIAFSKCLSKSFNVLMADLDIFVNADSSKPKILSGVLNLNVKLLYKQQVFESVLAQLISAFKSVEDDLRREVLLSTLAIIISNVSTKILKPHLQEVFPMVLNGLTFDNESILDASLLTFKVIIYESPSLILENLGSLIAKLVDLSTTKKIVDRKLVNTEHIRLLSLDCLMGIFQNLLLAEVVKYQVPVRNRLSVGLDDRKRSVRKKASDVRQMLYELDR